MYRYIQGLKKIGEEINKQEIQINEDVEYLSSEYRRECSVRNGINILRTKKLRSIFCHGKMKYSKTSMSRFTLEFTENMKDKLNGRIHLYTIYNLIAPVEYGVELITAVFQEILNKLTVHYTYTSIMNIK